MLLGLVSLGFMFAKKTGDTPDTGQFAPTSPHELSQRRRYIPASTIQDARNLELVRAQDAERAARYPMQTGAVDPRARAYAKNQLDAVPSQLAGVTFEAGDFRHNNMQPYFGSNVKNVSRDNTALLEAYTGAPGPGPKNKSEVAPFFPAGEMTSMTNIYGNQSFADTLQGRLDDMGSVNRVHNNELPFQQVKVGKGVGQGYTTTPTGGFGQNQDRDFAMPRYKDVDELRPGNKPKVNLEGRVIAGAVPSGSRGLMGQSAKNRPNTAFDIEGFGDVGSRAAAADGPTGRSDPIHGRQLKSPPTAFRLEGAGSAARGAALHLEPGQVSKVGAPKLDQTAPKPIGAYRTGVGSAAAEDMHRSVEAPSQNERNKSNVRWASDYASSIEGPAAVLRSGPPGAVHVPGRDVRNIVSEGMRLSGKENTSDASDAHMFGNMAPQAPGRGPAYDPIVHRPKTTIKETQIHDERLGSYKNEQGQVAEEGFGTRHTVREHFCDTFETYGVRNPQPPMVQEGVGAPDADPRSHRMKTTINDIAVCSPYLGGVATSGAQFQAAGGYDVSATGREEPQLTNRQFTEQNEYFGSGGRPESTAYGVVEGNMRGSMHVSGGRSSAGNYFGAPADKNPKGIDYESIYTTTLNEAKQSLLKSRTPGGHGGTARAPDVHTQGEIFARTNDPYVENYVASGNMPKNRGGVGSVAFQNNTGLSHDDRIDQHLLSYLKTNPLVINPAVKAHAENI